MSKVEELIGKFVAQYDAAIKFFAEDFGKYSCAVSTEEDLKVAFVEPLLNCCGIVPYLSGDNYYRREFRFSKGKPVDYYIGTPCGSILLETKAPKVGMLGLKNGKEFEQLLSYLRYGDIDRGILTNGKEWIVVDLKNRTRGSLTLFKPVESKDITVLTLDVVALKNLVMEILEGHSSIAYENIEVVVSSQDSDGMKQVFTHERGRRFLSSFEADYEGIYKNGKLYSENWLFFNGVSMHVGKRFANVSIGGFYIITEHWYMTIGKQGFEPFGSKLHMQEFACAAVHMSNLCGAESVVDYYLPNGASFKNLKQVYQTMIDEFMKVGNDKGNISFSFFGVV